MSVLVLPIELENYADSLGLSESSPNQRILCVQSAASSILYYVTYGQLLSFFKTRRAVGFNVVYTNIAAPSAVTDLEIPVSANTGYFLEFEIAITADSPTTNTVVFDLNGPAGTLTGGVTWDSDPSTFNQINKAYLSAIGGADSVSIPVNTSTNVKVTAAYYPTAAGTLSPRFYSLSGTGTFTVRIDSVAIHSS